MKFSIYPILVFLFVFLAQNSFSQPGQRPAREQIEAQKIAFITNKLNLSVEESQSFWPLYNEMNQKREAIRKKRSEISQQIAQNHATLSDAETEKLADEFVGLEVQEARLRQEYHGKFKNVLPIQKVIRLYHAESQFKNHLLRQIQQRRQRRGR